MARATATAQPTLIDYTPEDLATLETRLEAAVEDLDAASLRYAEAELARKQARKRVDDARDERDTALRYWHEARARLGLAEGDAP